MGAAGVVANAAAHAGPVGRGRVGGVLQAIGQQMAVQGIQHNPRLHPRPPLLRIDLDNLVQVLAEIHHDGVVDRLAGQAGAAGPGQYRNPAIPGDFQHRQHIRDAAGDNHAHRLHLVNGGVGAVKDPGKGVKAHFPGDPLFQRRGQFGPFPPLNPLRRRRSRSHSQPSPVNPNGLMVC